MQVFALAMVGLLSTAAAMYSAGDDVVQLTPANFDKEVMNSDALWLIEFYAPWCGHCQSLTPEWKKAAKALKGIVKVAAVDADAHGQLGQKYGVQGFPTIKVFGGNKNKPEDYQGGRTANAIVDTAMSKAKAMVNDRMSGRGGRSGGGSSGGSKSGDPKDVIELTDGNFQELVLDSEDLWLVEFFAPWCGHCKNLAPHWQSAASQMKGKVKFGAVDATVHTVYASRYGVRGYPTIKMFPAGKKDGEAAEYDGGRTASDIVAWATDKVAANIPPPEAYQVTSQDVLTQNCQDQQICVVAVLPHILDCQADCRNKYLAILKAMGEKYKKNQWGWVWSEAAAQPELESALGIGGFGYPAMAALNSRKKLYVLLKGPFSESGINEYLRDLSYGKGSSVLMKDSELPKVQTLEPWDGKDGVLDVEDEIDLSDVELDDLKDEL
ncbi:LOW QUALITY PROTEIN: protein disulfide-isomerase A6-like [Pecten maximus]|uniref:LOW QUALITY PROTEIN: protein disulfide-isomerase A6-like n=1 Tax=Pecten maximus TaxID=6579 RepID=UPI00145804A6|nr:LOW QUALITY PROTEIN: protein disulfide-isomerase A6-like [Pecten maximus]